MSDPNPRPGHDHVHLSPTGGVELPEPSAERVEALDLARASEDPKREIGDVAARWPDFIDAWAALGDIAYEAGNRVDAYAFYRTAYHRSLDSLRKNGWRGAGRVLYSHRPNRGFHKATYGLMRVSSDFGDSDEAQRCRQLLLDADPSDPLGAGS